MQKIAKLVILDQEVSIYRVPTLLVIKNSISRTQEAFFQDPVLSQQCLNIETNHIYI